jgi:hypothetical protein
LNDLGKAWVIFNIGGDCHLPTRLQSGKDNRRQIGTSSVNAGGQTGGTCPDDNNMFMKGGVGCCAGMIGHFLATLSSLAFGFIKAGYVKGITPNSLCFQVSFTQHHVSLCL